MDAREARELIPGLVIVSGFAAAVIDAGQQLYFWGIGGRAGLWASSPALLAGVVYSVGVSIGIARNHRFERVPCSEVRMERVMSAAIMMLMSGFSGDRRGLAAGLILLASVLAANYLVPHTPGYALAAGFILGYAIPGFSFISQGPRGEE